MSIDLQTAVKHNVTLVSGEALVNPMRDDGWFEPPRTFRKIIRWCLAGCLLVVLLPVLWMFWENVRPLSQHEKQLVGTWSVGSEEAVFRNDEDLSGIPCGMPSHEYRFLPDRTFHARRFGYRWGRCSFASETGPALHDVEGRWEIKGDRIVLAPMKATYSIPEKLLNAARELFRGQNPLDSFDDLFGHEINVVEWRDNGLLFSDSRSSVSQKRLRKLHPSNGDLLTVDSPLIDKTWPSMLAD